MKAKRRASVGAHGDAPAGAVEVDHRLPVAFLDTHGLFDEIVGNPLVLECDNIFHRRQGWHQIRAMGEHFIDTFGVHENAVVNRANAAADRVEDPLGALRMNGAGTVEAIPLVDTGGYFLGRVMGVLRDDAGRHGPADGHDFDQVGASLNLFAHRLDDLVNAIGHAAIAVTMAAGHTNHLSRGHDRRSKLAAAVSGAAHSKFQEILAAAIADRGCMVSHGHLGVGQGAHDDLTRPHFHHADRGVGLTLIDQVGMAIDQAQQQDGTGGVDRTPVKPANRSAGATSAIRLSRAITP